MRERPLVTDPQDLVERQRRIAGALADISNDDYALIGVAGELARTLQDVAADESCGQTSTAVSARRRIACG
jgi:hypothetical protein